MPIIAESDIKKLQRSGVITNLAGVVVSDWRWLQNRLYIEPRGENESFKLELDRLRADGITETIPVAVPGTNNVGIGTRVTPLQEANVAQLDMALKRVGFFLHETVAPVR